MVNKRKWTQIFFVIFVGIGWGHKSFASETSSSSELSVLNKIKPLFRGPMKDWKENPSPFAAICKKEWYVDKPFIRSLKKKQWKMALFLMDAMNPDPNYEPTFYYFGEEKHTWLASHTHFYHYYPLHICADAGEKSLSVVKKLLERGANPFCLTRDFGMGCETPFSIAARVFKKPFSLSLNLMLFNAMLAEMRKKGIIPVKELPFKKLPKKGRGGNDEVHDIFKAFADLLIPVPKYDSITTPAANLARRYLYACFMAQKAIDDRKTIVLTEGKDFLGESQEIDLRTVDEDGGEYDELLEPGEEPFGSYEEAPYLTTADENIVQEKYFTQSPKDFYYSLKLEECEKKGGYEE